MSLIFKNKVLDLESEPFSEFFVVQSINVFNKIYIINEDDYEKVIRKEKINDILVISEEVEVYKLLKYINNSSSVYLKKRIYDDSLIDTIKNYRGNIVILSEITDFLQSLNMLNDNIVVDKNEYVMIDNLGKITKIDLNN